MFPEALKIIGVEGYRALLTERTHLPNSRLNDEVTGAGGWPVMLLLSLLFVIGSYASSIEAGGIGPIEDHYYGASLFIVETGHKVWPPVAVESLAEYVNIYGELTGPGIDHGLRAAQLFFANGGASLFVIDPGGTDIQDFADALDRSVDLPVDLVAIPGAACCQAPPLLHSAIMNLLTDHVDRSPNRFGLVDAPMDSAADALIDYRATLSSNHAALYAPWLSLPGPRHFGSVETVPSSSAVAGVISRIDRAEGIYKSPAGIDAVLCRAAAHRPRARLERGL